MQQPAPAEQAGQPPAAAPARRTLRDHQRDYTRKRLLTAGRELFERNGYAATKVDDIAAAADASKATVYAYFKTKVELLLALWEGVDADFERRYQDLDQILFGGARPSRGKVRAWLATQLEFWKENGKLIDATRQARAVEPAMAGVDENVTGANCIDCMTRFLARDPGRRELNRQRAVLTERMTSDTFEQLSIGNLKVDEDVVLDLLTDQWWMVFRSAPTRASSHGS
jgi:AcrR family transcriptional regulator